MKGMFAAIGLMSLLLPFGGGQRSYTPAELTTRTRPSMVYIQYANGKETHYCAGFVVDGARRWAMTAAHCVDRTHDVTVDGELTQIVKLDEQLAIVTVPPPLRPPLKLRDSDVKLGEPVQAMGYGYTLFTTFSRNAAALDGGDFAMDGALAPGMSGGPVVDEHGDVVGLGQAATDVIGIACGAGELRDFLGHAKKGK